MDGGATATYVYNASGQRVRKVSASGTVDYLYDLAGHLITEVSSTGTWTPLSDADDGLFGSTKVFGSDVTGHVSVGRSRSMRL